MNLPGISKIYHGGAACKSGFASSSGGSLITPYIASIMDDSESFTTSSSFVLKVTLPFAATNGIRYMIEYNFEMFAAADEDCECNVTLNGTEIAFAHFKNSPFADRWAQLNTGFYIINTLTGAQTVNINYRNGYGVGNKGIRRARIVITRLN